MSKNKEEIRSKWLFINKEEVIPGLILDNLTYEQMIGWMDITSYEDARYRINREEVEHLIIEFVEMMWSVEPDYYELKTILEAEFQKKIEPQEIIVECNVNNNTIKLLKKISMRLNKTDKHIRVLTLYVRKQPNLSILEQKLNDLSEEFTITDEEDSICIEWIGKKVVVNVEQ